MVFEVGWSESCHPHEYHHALSMAESGAEMAESWAVHAVEAPDSISHMRELSAHHRSWSGSQEPCTKARGGFIYMVSFKMQQRHLVVSSFFATLTSGLLVS